MTRLLCLLLLLAGYAFADEKLADPEDRPGFDWKPLSRLAIQERGRVKPLETYANESVLFITGKRQWKNFDNVEVLFGWLIAFDREWEDEAFLRLDYGPLKKKLGLDESRKFFTPNEIRKNEVLPTLLREVAAKDQRKEKLSEFDKKVVELQNRRGLLEAIAAGQTFNILPNPEGLTKTWFPLSALTEGTQLPYAQGQLEELSKTVRDLLDTFVANSSVGFSQATERLVTILKDGVGKGAYPTEGRIDLEIHYNHLRPFHWAWIFYTVAFVLLLGFIVTRKGPFKYGGMSFFLVAFLLHTYGFSVRCLIAERPPVTNMYESVIWVTWGCVLFSGIIWAVYRNYLIPAAAVVFAIAGLVLADNLPLVLDPNIHPLEPVLRSNFWLTIHVLTITLSYAAFALSLCLGNVVIGYYLLKPGHTAHIQQFSLYMYRAIQIGVVLLAAGTILGGVWADYSWGRFWGWDPKEVWALIALLLYLAVLHGRFTGWLRGFGFAATTVISFLGVLMAWYGVNFVLGVGLHSYGFGTGGMAYVSAYVMAQLAYIVAAYLRFRQAKAKHGVREGSIFPRPS